MTGKLVASFIGLLFIVLGIIYKKTYHEKKFGKDIGQTGVNTGSFLGDIFGSLLLFILAILPWYFIKSIFILLGLVIIVLACFY
ncbi:hypothetical protein [Priestia megaterium]|uniref:hypothetical protein n=1 Tax=Priestia megaterium TaxID=1404 RepID=UPI002364617A|nr:hypothetical protein [Priestia megaterium]MDD1515379.1 hypothetical protein [Priestia megaterium]